MSSQFSDLHESNVSVAQHPLRVAASDAYRGFFAFTHNGMALVGVALAALALTLAARADLRTAAEQQLLGWLLQRHDITALSSDDTEARLDTPGRVLTAEPSLLPKQQAAVTEWLSRRYRVAQEPLASLVAEAFATGEKVRLDPTLILAVMAIESRFNPYAQSPVGAQGLMQVLTRVHTDKYADAGGHAAAFDPLTNLRVGVKVLQDCIKQAGSVEGGLRLYVGAVSSDGGDYINKVMSEHLRIQSVALGKPMPTSFPVYSATPVVSPAAPGLDVPTQTGLLEPDAEAMPSAPPAQVESRPSELASS